MNLSNYLRQQGYDMISGPVRNHKLLQLWLKEPLNEIQIYYQHLEHAFKSEVPLTPVANAALSINSSKKDEYNFNIGITLLEDILKSMGLGALEFSTKIKSGKKVNISYDNSETLIVPIGEIESYLSTADFKYPNPSLLRNANKGQVIIIDGVVSAKNLLVDIETDFDVNTDLMVSLNAVADGKLNFSVDNNRKIKMVSSGNQAFPVALHANRLDFDKGKFAGFTLVSDNRNWF